MTDTITPINTQTAMNTNNTTTTDNTETTPITQHPAVVWLREEYLPRAGGNMSRASRELGMSHKVLNALLAGNYSGDTDRQLAKLEEQRQRLSAQIRGAEGIDLEYVPTQLMGRVWSVCDAAKVAHLCNFIAGKSQIGKSTAVEAYRQRYPETTILMRMPTDPTIFSLLRELATAAGLPRPRSTADAMETLREHLSPRHLIIADEVHLALSRRQGLDALDVLRELYDRCRCGLVLIVTDIGARQIVNGPHAERLGQFEKRGEWELLPEAPSARDVAAIWEAYGLPQPDAETQRTIGALARQSCFGQYVHRLKLAACTAQQQGHSLTWDDFIASATRMGRRPQ